MNIKKIEIFGFKSFADKLVIDFNEGINCIVGPNGCGKSNVADAIRWVLGEQSARVLRAQKSMSEIIFDGTKNRRSLSYCEVLLHFDNLGRTYAIDYDEVIISRKLFRSGESEYCINNEKVRLRDIVDLFRDTGIGREGYSIIGQGRINDILSVKPDERRQIFEEAAGISKFKAKRTVAERKLTQARENMVRIYDRMIGLEQDLGPLEKEAEDATLAREFKEELKLLEVNTYIYHRENNASRRNEIYDKLNELSTQMDEKNIRLNEINVAYDKVIFDIEDTDKTFKDMYDKKIELSLKNQRVLGEQESTLNKLEEHKKKEIELEMEISQKERELEETRYRLQQKKGEKEEALKKLIEKRKEENQILQQQIDAEEEFKNKDKELADTNKFILSSADEKGEIKAEVAMLQTQISGLEDTIKQTKDTLSTANLALNDAKKKKSVVDEELQKLEAEYAEKKAQKDEIDAKHAEILDYLQQAETQQKRVEQNVNNLKTKAEMLEEYKKNYAGFAEAVKSLVNSNDEGIKSRIKGVVGEVITVAPNLQVAIEIALGRSIQNIITENQEDTSYLVNYLKKNDYGRATFLALSRIVPRQLRREYRDVLDEPGCIGVASDLIRYDRVYKNIFGFLLGGIIIVEDMATANRLSKKYQSGFRIVTLDGEDFAIGGATTGGSKPRANTSILSRDSVLKEAYKEITTLTNKFDIIVNEVKEYKAELKQLEQASNVLQHQMLKLDKELSAGYERKNGIEAELQRLLSATSKLAQEMDDNSNTLQEKKALYKKENSKINDAESKKISADELLARLSAEYASCKNKLTVLTDKTTEMKLSLNSIEHTVAAIEGQINNFENDIKHYISSITDLKARKCTNEAMVERLTKNLTVCQMPDEEKEELEIIENKIKEIDDYKLSLKQQQEKLRNEENKIKSIITDLMVEKNKQDNKLENLDSDIVQLEIKVTEDYELNYEDALKLKQENFENEKAATRIRKLKRSLARLGEINEKAVEQFADKNSEYEELSIHYKDITDAEQSLLSTIKDLTQKMERTFKDNFEKIQENFKVIFKDMFDGGRGYLELEIVPGGSVLDAGIKISAEPPGKKLKNIALLSGGEQALTAIAILFAIIKLKPMPFCVLDEIEASLDDANAYLFAQYLRKFARNTQFVVITHRKPTMELADSLYGVTMQEKGVSKVVSVKLSTALKNVG